MHDDDDELSVDFTASEDSDLLIVSYDSLPKSYLVLTESGRTAAR